ncbi:MAG: hypothetical protein JNM28_11630 [Armatimonadetes bacterium]|nr:hypothetical protein [Armatimonadota bacterium]MBS1712053.1 hypothetical protein [Armatimonadota bacterium]MBX3109393.1 hypothetical protein [Fimbriimonadaceae bacterium]
MKRLGQFGILVALITLVACGPKNVIKLKRDVPAAQVQAGWYLCEQPTFSIVVPESYQVPKEAGASLGDLQNMSNPGVGYSMSAPKESTTANASLILNNKDYRPLPGEPATGLTVNITKHGGGADLEAEAKRVTEEIFRSKSEKIELPVGPAYVIKHHGKMVTGDETWQEIYIVCDGESCYRVDFTTTNGEQAISAAPQIMQSFRVK